MARQPVEEQADDGRASEPRPGARASEPRSGTRGRPGREGLGGPPESGDGSVEAGPEAGRGAEPRDGGPEPQGSNHAADIPAQDVGQVDLRYTPLWRAQHESRYLRQELIKAYQARYGCRLVVMIDQIDPDSATLFAELLHGADPGLDLHLLLRSPGGDGEVAVRLARMAQAASRRFVVVVPDIAKSAATIFALGAHEIVMGPMSDLGPIDPQVFVQGHGYISAKEIMQAVDRALEDVSERPDSYPLHSALLGMGNVDATLYEFAKSALDRTAEIAKQAISSNADLAGPAVNKLVQKVTDRLITKTHTHSAVIGCAEARQVGLPVTELQIRSGWWQEIWAIWTRYFALGPVDEFRIYESDQASQVESTI